MEQFENPFQSNKTCSATFFHTFALDGGYAGSKWKLHQKTFSLDIYILKLDSQTTLYMIT